MSAEKFNAPVIPRKLSFDQLDDKTKRILLSRLDRFELSVRARNVLINAGLRVLGEAVQIPENQWLSLQNCGRKTIGEIRSLASQFGLELGTEIQEWPEVNASTILDSNIIEGSVDYSTAEIGQARTYPVEIDFENADKQTRAWLVEDLIALDFSVRSQNILVTLGLKTVGDLIALSAVDLLETPHCGRKTLKEITSLLAQRGLSLNTTVRNMNSHAASELRVELRRQKKTAAEVENRERVGPVLDAAKSLGEELSLVLSLVASGRNVQLIAKLWGWSGERPRTLESVGNEFGITRERVRQIEERARRKIRKLRLAAPLLIKAARLIRQSCPATTSMLSVKLGEASLAGSEVDFLGVINACEVLEIPLGLEAVNFGGSLVFSIRGLEIPLKAFERETRRRTQANGCVNFDALCDELRISDSVGERLRCILSNGEEFGWLNNDRTWFYSRKVARNRFLNLASKVLAVCPRLRSNELRKAVARSRRLEVTPPIEVLERLTQASGLATIEGGFLVANANAVERPAPGSIDDTFVNILRDHGPAISGRDFEELCIQAGINPISFYIYRSGSPVVSQLAPGVYSLVGAVAPPGLIEELAAKYRVSKRLVEYGWDKEGRLWCAVGLSRIVITAGSIALPSFVNHLVQGEWAIQLPGGSEVGTANCVGTFLSRLRKPLSYVGAEPGDFVLFQFDLHSRIMMMRIGDHELVDVGEAGDIGQVMED